MSAHKSLESKSRHLEKLHSERELQDDIDRLLWNDVSAASSFTDNKTRDALIRMTIDDNVEEIAIWLHDPHATETMAMTKTFDEADEAEMGRSLVHFGAAYDKRTGRVRILMTRTICVILGRRGLGFELFNAYPTVAAPYGEASDIDVRPYIEGSTAWKAATPTRYAYLSQLCEDKRWWVGYDKAQAAVVTTISEGGKRLGLVYVNESVATWEANHEGPVRIPKGCGQLLLRRAFPETLGHVRELWEAMERFRMERNQPQPDLRTTRPTHEGLVRPDAEDTRPHHVVTLASDETTEDVTTEATPTADEREEESPETGAEPADETEDEAVDERTEELLRRAKEASADIASDKKVKGLTKADRARLRAQRRSAKNQPKKAPNKKRKTSTPHKKRGGAQARTQPIRLHRVPTRAETQVLSQTDMNEAFVATCLAHNIAFVNRNLSQMLAFDSSVDFEGKLCVWTFDETAVDDGIALWQKRRPQSNPEGARFTQIMTAIGDRHGLVVHTERNQAWRSSAAKAIAQDACWEPMTLPGHEDWFDDKICTERGQIVRRECEHELNIDLIERFQLTPRPVSERAVRHALSQYEPAPAMPNPPANAAPEKSPRLPGMSRVWDTNSIIRDTR